MLKREGTLRQVTEVTAASLARDSVWNYELTSSMTEIPSGEYDAERCGGRAQKPASGTAQYENCKLTRAG